MELQCFNTSFLSSCELILDERTSGALIAATLLAQTFDVRLFHALLVAGRERTSRPLGQPDPQLQGVSGHALMRVLQGVCDHACTVKVVSEVDLGQLDTRPEAAMHLRVVYNGYIGLS